MSDSIICFLQGNTFNIAELIRIVRTPRVEISVERIINVRDINCLRQLLLIRVKINKSIT